RVLFRSLADGDAGTRAGARWTAAGSPPVVGGVDRRAAVVRDPIGSARHGAEGVVPQQGRHAVQLDIVARAVVNSRMRDLDGTFARSRIDGAAATVAGAGIRQMQVAQAGRAVVVAQA